MKNESKKSSLIYQIPKIELVREKKINISEEKKEEWEQKISSAKKFLKNKLEGREGE